MGRWHVDALVRLGARLVAICDEDAGAAERLGSRHGIDVSSNLDGLLDATQPEVVHICTPLKTHAPLIQRVLEHGCHVIVEKPLAETPEETARLLTLATESKRLLFPTHQLLFQRWIPQVAQLGDVRSMDYVVCSAGAQACSSARQDEVVTEVLPHPLSLFALFCPQGLDAFSWQATRSGPGELRVSGANGGISLNISASMSERPIRHELTIAGEGGTLHADLFHGFATREFPHIGRRYKIARPFSLSARRFVGAGLNLGRRALSRESAYPGLRELIHSCYRQIRNQASLPLSPQHAASVARARHEIRRLAQLATG